MSAIVQKLLSTCVVSLLLSPSVSAFEIPLSENSVREAYFLGQRTDQKCADFLNLYRHGLPVPDKGPYVSEIRLLTPYAQVVAESNRRTVGFSAQQAAANYHGRGDTILVQIRVELTPTFTYEDARHIALDLSGEVNRHLEPEDFWRDFQISLSQTNEAHGEKVFEPSSVEGEPIYSRPTGAGGGQYLGTIVTMEFDAAGFDSAPARVEIITSTGDRATTDFDLATLR